MNCLALLLKINLPCMCNSISRIYIPLISLSSTEITLSWLLWLYYRLKTDSLHPSPLFFFFNIILVTLLQLIPGHSPVCQWQVFLGSSSHRRDWVIAHVVDHSLWVTCNCVNTIQKEGGKDLWRGWIKEELRRRWKSGYCLGHRD